MATKAELEGSHLADLHALAARLGVTHYRMLRREELIEEIAERGGDVVAEAPEPAHPEPRPAEEPPEPREEPRGGEEAEAEPVTGILDVMPQRYGFLRLGGLEPSGGDVYIAASQIRRCELRPGDEVSGPARPPRRGERYPALVHVDEVNGAAPEELEGRPEFDDLTPVAPSRRLRIGPEAGDLLTRAVDLLVPLAFGQRVLVWAAPRSGRTTLLRGLARALGAEALGAEAPALIVLLVDERPEEATAWREALRNGELAVATADMSPAEQARVAELALARAKRRAERGEDAVLIVDSLSRLALAQGDAAAVKHAFGAGRELAEDGTGSLTVIATVLDGAGEGNGARAAVITTENALIRLDPALAAAGIFPALRPEDCRAAGEEELREPEELEAVRRLRAELGGKEPAEAAALLRERLEAAPTNAELLRSL